MDQISSFARLTAVALTFQVSEGTDLQLAHVAPTANGIFHSK
jgi:hypothetical protein